MNRKLLVALVVGFVLAVSAPALLSTAASAAPDNAENATSYGPGNHTIDVSDKNWVYVELSGAQGEAGEDSQYTSGGSGGSGGGVEGWINVTDKDTLEVVLVGQGNSTGFYNGQSGEQTGNSAGNGGDGAGASAIVHNGNPLVVAGGGGGGGGGGYGRTIDAGGDGGDGGEVGNTGGSGGSGGDSGTGGPDTAGDGGNGGPGSGEVVSADVYKSQTSTGANNGDASLTVYEYDSAHSPQISNPQPPDGTNIDDYNTTLSVDITDGDEGEPWADDHNVTVTFYDASDDSVIGTDTLAQNGTATTQWQNMDLGQNDWYVVAEDNGNKTTTSATWSIYTPGTLEIRDELDQTLVTGSSANVTVSFFPETDAPITERTTDDGTVDLEGLPSDQDIVVRVDADGYATRTVIIQDVAEQHTVYLLDAGASSVEVRFILEDLTGQYPEESALYVSKPITNNSQTEYKTIHADQFGVDGVTATLEEGERYRLRIVSPSGTTQDLGPYRAATSETVTVQPGTASIDLSEDEDGWQSGATLSNRTIYATYEDPTDSTDSVTMTVYERDNRSNQLAASETYHDLGSVSTKWALTANQSEKEWVVVMDVERGGETATVEHVVGAGPDGVIDGLSGHWRVLFGIIALFLFGGMFSVLNRAVGAVMVSVVGGILWWTGWLAGATAGVAVVIYMFVAFTYAIYVGSRQ